MTMWRGIFLLLCWLPAGCASQPVADERKQTAPVRTAIYEDEHVRFRASIADGIYRSRDTLFVELSISSRNRHTIYIPRRFEDSDVLVPDTDFRFAIDVGLNFWRDSDPMMHMSAPAFMPVGRRAVRRLGIPLADLVQDRKEDAPMYFEVSFLNAYMAEIDGLEHLLRTDGQEPELTSEGQYFLFDSRVREVSVGPIGFRVESVPE